MNDRITVHIAENTSAAELRGVAREVAASFDLSLTEAEALLKADVIMLKQDEAEALVAICQRLGIRGKMTKPAAPASKGARLRRGALPWLLALLGTALLVTLVSLVLPKVSVPSIPPVSIPPVSTPPVSNTPITTSTETAQVLPVATENPGDDGAVPQIASETVPDGGRNATETDEAPQVASAEVPIIASAPADMTVAAEPVEAVPDLFTAARDLSAADVERVLEVAPEVDARDAYGQTPLMYAAGSNLSAVVTALLAAGADMNASSDAGWTPLMYAARNTRDPGVVQALLAAGADAQILNESGQGARDIALAYNNSAAAFIPEPTRTRADADPVVANPVTQSPTGGSRSAAPTLPVRTAVTPVAVPPAPATPTVGGGTPIQVTPRPLPNVLPVVVQPPDAVPVNPSAQDEQRNIILNCLQNWDSCGN